MTMISAHRRQFLRLAAGAATLSAISRVARAQTSRAGRGAQARKPAQMLEHTGNDGKPIGRITVEFVHRNEQLCCSFRRIAAAMQHYREA